ncbi:MAG: hypothetical protein ACFCUT_17545 [Kiloniellaceae bacterium]
MMHKWLANAVQYCLMATVKVAVIGMWQMGRIGAEIESLSEADLPLAELISHLPGAKAFSHRSWALEAEAFGFIGPMPA